MKKALWFLYLVLLIASAVVRGLSGREARPLPVQQVIRLPEYDHGRETGGRVDMAYADLPPEGIDHPPVVLLLHGVPMTAYDLRGFAEALAARGYRVLTPDLPGFGRSTRRIPDYGFEAQADVLAEFLDRKQTGPVHVIAYSQGGGPAMALWTRRPASIASMTFLSAIGVQEFELLGNYGINHSIHALQHGFLTAVFNLVPHFGLLDRNPLNLSYTRNFLASDLRGMRDAFATLTVPTLVLHGRDDVLVHPGSAHETARLVPQAEQIILDGGHLLALRRPEVPAAPVAAFLDRVEAGTAVTRAQADPARVAEAEAPFNPDQAEKVMGFALVVMILVIALSTLVSEDLACIAAGLMVAKGILGYAPAAFAAFLGIFLGDLALFQAGRWLGRPALRRPPLRWFLREEAIQDSAAWFARRGPVVILLSRFIPGSRLPTFFAAGMLHQRVMSFVLYFLIAGVLWAPLLVWLSSTLGETLLEVFAAYKMVTLTAVLSAAAVIWLAIKIVVPSFTFKGRRRLVSRWRRLTRWEFWPLWVFYPPVLAWIGGLALRHRGLHVVAAANPAMPCGGLVGESKKAILDAILAREPWVAAYELIPGNLSPEEKEAAVLAFLDARQKSFPVVVKPDQGQRGQGVAVLRSRGQLSAYFSRARPDTLVQDHVPGYEVGIFYYRMPGMARGKIFSITEKRFPVLTGDGKHDLEHLILKDDRAVCMAPRFLAAHREHLTRVLDDGETFPLVELGTHCRGAIFQDGIWLKTPALEKAIDEIAQSYDGFYFGRFDVRCPNLEDLKEGRNFKVIELNGVTSEATHIYNPGNTLQHAYSVLFRQWAIAFRIGARNLRDGVPRCRLRDALAMWLNFHRAPDA